MHYDPNQPEEQRGYQGNRSYGRRRQPGPDRQQQERGGRHQLYNVGNRLGATSIDLQPNVAAALSYLGWWLTGLFFVIGERRNRFVRFHAIQSIFAFAILSLIWIVLQIIFSIPIIGLVGCFLKPVFLFITLAIWLGLMAIAFLGRRVKIPVIGDFAERLAGHDTPT